jgi:hypothetical protein
MRILAAGLGILGVGVLGSLVGYSEPQTAEPPRFQTEIQAASEKGSTFTLTNHSGKTLTACFIEISSSLERRQRSGIGWDALVQGIEPLAPGESTSMPLGHVVGGPIPDKVEISAGVWADGETFGRTELVARLLKTRNLRESEYDEAISFLGGGIEQGWSRDQFLAALSGKKPTGPFYAIRSTLRANKNLDQKPQLVQRVVQTLLESLSQKREVLRQAKPQRSALASP